ncbi:MAG: tRNA uridine-5-carboxymethylaminomethyl(34) synthesis enzyme MnmG, partial [Gammaproteobacteria bacterium]|nr:tRNA uridine-5-carboxymethylaminomethyl(34) synthesis enzyme MnmG [Gammaproteobacteria bacterium]
QLERLNQALNDQWVRPGTSAASAMDRLLQNPISREYRLNEILKRPEVEIDDVMSFIDNADGFSRNVREQAEVNVKYAGYLVRQQQEIDKASRHEQTELPQALDYTEVRGLSNEVCQKLALHRPATIGQASRISGITPAAISLLLVHLKRHQHKVQKSA